MRGRPIVRIGWSVARAVVLSLVFLIPTALLVVPSAQGAPLLGNLANGVGGPFGGNPDSADEFATGNAALNITDIDVLWETGFGGTANRVGIFTDASGLPSGTQVGTWFTSGAVTADNTLINYTGSANLAANTTYHLVIDILDDSNVAFTFDPAVFADPSTLGASNALGSSFGDIQTVSWNEDGANLVWQLNGSAGANAVPTPATLLMVAVAAASMGAMRARRRR